MPSQPVVAPIDPGSELVRCTRCGRSAAFMAWIMVQEVELGAACDDDTDGGSGGSLRRFAERS